MLDICYAKKEYNTTMKIQWNKVTWYSKLIALILFVALPFIGFYYGMQYGKAVALIGQPLAVGNTTSMQNSNSGLLAYYMNTAEWQTDANNTAGGFSIAYPIDFDAQDNNSVTPSTNWSVNATTPGIQYFTLTVPSTFEPQTNLAGVTLTVGGSQNDSAISQCLTPNQNDGPATATSSATINGIQFTIFQSSGVGAGNMYRTTSYRTLHAGECYAVEYTIHSTQIANYPPSYNLQPFDETKVTTLMQNIIGTFKFL
jgi:hypothetical protein